MILRILNYGVSFIGSMFLLIDSLVGLIRFLLIVKFDPFYLSRRYKWYQEKMLGRKIKLRDITKFGSWHQNLSR